MEFLGKKIYLICMEWDEAAEKILIKMLGHLGFEIQVARVEDEDGVCLNISTDEAKCVIGRNGDRLEDIQYLVNRVLQKHYPDAPRVKVDCDSYRMQQEQELIEKARKLAEKVVETGKSIRTAAVKTTSPKSSARYKRIEIEPSHSAG